LPRVVVFYCTRFIAAVCLELKTNYYCNEYIVKIRFRRMSERRLCAMRDRES